MALFTVGSVDDFSVVPGDQVRSVIARDFGLGAGDARARRAAGIRDDDFGLDSARVLRQAAGYIPVDDFGFAVSAEPRGLGLQSLRLEKEAQKFVRRLFHRTSKVYFVAWGWDLSGQPVYCYPDAGVGAGSVMIPIRAGDIREFLGSGALLFPARQVTSGLQIRIQIWDSRAGVRRFGEAMSAVAAAIHGSSLNAVITTLAPIGGPVTEIIAAAKEAAALLASVIGPILETYGDEVLDFYEGNYPASQGWPLRPESHKGHGTSIVLSRFS